MKNLYKALIAGFIGSLALGGCNNVCDTIFVSDADIASHNVSKAADNFEINRRIVFYNGITDTYMLTIEGYCSLGNNDKQGQLSVTCKTGPNEYKKHFLGLSHNVTYIAEQVDSSSASVDHYRVFFRPSAIIPDIDVK